MAQPHHTGHATGLEVLRRSAPLEVLPGDPEDERAEQQQGDQVRYRHEGIEGVRNQPDHIEFHNGPDRDRQHPGHTERKDRPAS